MRTSPLLQKLDAVTIPVPDLDSGLRFYRDALGHELRWRHDAIGQAGLALPASDTEIVLTTTTGYAPDWLVTSADEATRAWESAGGQVITGPSDIPVGRLAVVRDPFGNTLVLLDLSKGHYLTNAGGSVSGLAPTRTVPGAAPDAGGQPDAGTTAVFAVTTAKGLHWDHARGIREQPFWEQHAAFADNLAGRGLIILGGPVASDDDEVIALLAVRAPDEDAARSVFAADPWTVHQVFRIKDIRAWTLWLDGRASQTSP